LRGRTLNNNETKEDVKRATLTVRLVALLDDRRVVGVLRAVGFDHADALLRDVAAVAAADTPAGRRDRRNEQTEPRSSVRGGMNEADISEQR
jgi:hypothetical protein